MSYADITFKDKNPIKRWLQMSRLATAMRLVTDLPSAATICDFGAGNGELCKLIALKYPSAKLICYEPTPSLLLEAKSNLVGCENVQFCSDLSLIPKESVDVVFSLEVFEHLPFEETRDAIQDIKGLLNEQGIAILGVPIEIGLPALYKGVFRMTRRFGDFDAAPKNVLLSFLGMPPQERPIAEITKGFNFHFHHMGFDYRVLRKKLGKDFKLRKTAGSPFPLFGAFLNPEIYFVVSRATAGINVTPA